MKKVFVDTNGWIALNSKRDQFHKAAIEKNQELLRNGARYITTNYVLDETYTGLLMKVGHVAAVDFGEKIRQSKILQVLFITREFEEAAWQLFKQYTDKDYSFTDCTSFIVMNQAGLTEVLTNDHHFAQMGYTILLH